MQKKLMNKREEGMFVIMNSNCVIGMMQPFWLHQEIKKIISIRSCSTSSKLPGGQFCMATDFISKVAAVMLLENWRTTLTNNELK